MFVRDWIKFLISRCQVPNRLQIDSRSVGEASPLAIAPYEARSRADVYRCPDFV
jgi:hypothetical protein